MGGLSLASRRSIWSWWFLFCRSNILSIDLVQRSMDSCNCALRMLTVVLAAIGGDFAVGIVVIYSEMFVVFVVFVGFRWSICCG